MAQIEAAPRAPLPWREFLTEDERAYLAKADAEHPATWRAREDWRRRFADRPRIIQRGYCRARAAIRKHVNGANADDA
jgi:hypothetical protein